MLYLLFFLAGINAKLIAYTSYYSKSNTISNLVSIFGNPALYTVYGKAAFITGYPNSNTFSSLTGNFAVFFNYKNYTLAGLALLSQNAGAVGVAFVSQSSSWDFTSATDTSNDSKMVNIVAIGIQKADANSLKSLTGNVWMIYKLDLIQSESPKISLSISGNYTKDYEFAKAIKQINTNIPLTKLNFSVYANAPYTDDYNLVKNTDCMYYNSYYYLCMSSTSTVLGKDRVYNTIMILKLFDSVTSLTEFFNTLMNLYTYCEFDYLQTCISSQLTTVSQVTINDIYKYYYSFKQGSYYPSYYIRSQLFYWPSYLQSAFCLSYYTAPAGCTFCSNSCSYSSIQNSYCDASCNVSSCSYDNINCITTGGCYNFLLGDGQCDSVCSNDPDCSNSTVCAPGCLYSDMKNGLCPLACTGNCFSSCSTLYCSPGCLYKDLYSGICSTNCTSSCLKNCVNSDTCAAGCLYSDMQNGLCPSACSGTCFQYCSTDYCSPNCLTKDLLSGYCSSSCTSSCLQNCVDSSDICASGCLFSHMNYGYCPVECASSSCFSFCNPNIYCSPGCDYYSLSSGECSADCTDTCLDKCDVACSAHCNEQFINNGYCPYDCTDVCCKKSYKSSDSNDYTLVYILPPIGAFFIILVVVVCILCFRRRRRLLNRQQSSYNASSNVVRPMVPPMMPVANNFVQYLNGNIQPNPALNYNSHSNIQLYPVPFNQSLRYMGEPLCTVDLTEFKIGEAVIMPPCMHLFHPNCLKEWLDSGREKKCPNCNFSLQGVTVRLS